MPLTSTSAIPYEQTATASPYTQPEKQKTEWDFGFKLHLAINRTAQLFGYHLTAGNADDRNSVEKLCKGRTGSVYADRGYLSKGLATHLMKKGIRLVTRSRRNMPQSELSPDDEEMLNKRSIIETVIGVLKSRHHIAHTRHRSYRGLVVTVLLGLIAYCLSPNKIIC